MDHVHYDIIYRMQKNRRNDNELLVVSRTGLLIFDKTKEQFRINPWYNKRHTTNEIYQEGDSLIWLSGSGSQIKINTKLGNYQNHTFITKKNTAASSNFIRKIDEDEYWVGFFEHGPAILNKKNGQYYFMSDLPEIYSEFPKGNCISYLKTSAGSIWFGTDKGIFILSRNAKNFSHYHIKKPKSKYAFYHFVEDIVELGNKEAYLVISSMSKLPLLINKKTGEVDKEFKLSKKLKKEFENIDFRKIIQDSKGIYWLTSTQGLYSLNMNTYEVEFPKLKVEFDFSQYNLFYLQIDKDDNIYMSSHNPISLVKINGERDKVVYYSSFFEKNGIVTVSDLALNKKDQLIIFSDPIISSLDIKNNTFRLLDCPNYPDLVSLGLIRCGLVENEKVWIGYLGKGISIMQDLNDNCKIKNYKKGDGLNSNRIFEFEKDAKGNIWTATGNGISVIDPKSMESINFSQKDGLLNNNTGIYWASSLKYLDSGDMFLGGHSFFTIFNTDSLLNQSNEQFNPVFEAFLVYEQEKKLDLVINKKEEIYLKYNENFFSIEFANLSYSNILPTAYKYKLEAYDDDWVTTFSNKVQYKKVPPGEYRFVLSHAKRNII